MPSEDLYFSDADLFCELSVFLVPAASHLSAEMFLGRWSCLSADFLELRKLREVFCSAIAEAACFLLCCLPTLHVPAEGDYPELGEKCLIKSYKSFGINSRVHSLFVSMSIVRGSQREKMVAWVIWLCFTPSHFLFNCLMGALTHPILFLTWRIRFNV